MTITYQSGCLGDTVRVDDKAVEQLTHNQLMKAMDNLLLYASDEQLRQIITNIAYNNLIEPDTDIDDGACDQCGTFFTTKTWVFPKEVI